MTAVTVIIVWITKHIFSFLPLLTACATAAGRRCLGNQRLVSATSNNVQSNHFVMSPCYRSNGLNHMNARLSCLQSAVCSTTKMIYTVYMFFFMTVFIHNSASLETRLLLAQLARLIVLAITDRYTSQKDSENKPVWSSKCPPKYFSWYICMLS